MENNNGNEIQYKGKNRNSWINDDTNNDNISDDGRNASKTTKQSTPVKILSENNNNNNKRISRWFVSNQKTEAWDENKLNKLHILIEHLQFHPQVFYHKTHVARVHISNRNLPQ